MKSLSEGNKGIKALAKENPALVEERFGYDVPGYMAGGIAGINLGDIERYLERDEDFDYVRDVLGVSPDADSVAVSQIPESDRVAMAYGAPQVGDGRGSLYQALNYGNVAPGQTISIDARDETPAAYRFYPSEVSKIYSEAKGVPFSPLVAPPREATYVDTLGSRRIQSQLYAKEGTFVDAEEYPERDELVTGPGGEQGDKIPAMLSDGEFVFNAAAVRGMGIMSGASPEDEYEQRLMGARKMYEFQKQAEEMAKMYK
tara:strand:+ start:1537 stop:2310 length:774 start_codon:yes stop_codon:yes gene_type:complete